MSYGSYRKAQAEIDLAFEDIEDGKGKTAQNRLIAAKAHMRKVIDDYDSELRGACRELDAARSEVERLSRLHRQLAA